MSRVDAPSTSRVSTRARSSTTRRTLCSTAWSRKVPAGVDRGSRADSRNGRRPRAASGPHHVGRADPFGRKHRGVAVPAQDDQHQALALRTAPAPLRDLRLLRGARYRDVRRGQFELGVGRGQIEYLASLFHSDSPNDVAPTGYNLDPLDPELPRARSRRQPPRPASAGDSPAHTFTAVTHARRFTR